MSVHFIEDYEIFKIFGMKNFTFDQSLKIIDDINVNYNRKLQLLHESSTANSQTINFGFIRLKELKNSDTHVKQKFNFSINSKMFTLILDSLKGQNGIYCGYFIFSNQHNDIQSKLNELIISLLGTDSKYEIRFKKFENSRLWKLMVATKRDYNRIKIAFNNSICIENDRIRLIEQNNEIKNHLKSQNEIYTNKQTSTNATILQISKTMFQQNIAMETINKFMDKVITTITSIQLEIKDIITAQTIYQQSNNVTNEIIKSHANQLQQLQQMVEEKINHLSNKTSTSATSTIPSNTANNNNNNNSISSSEISSSITTKQPTKKPPNTTKQTKEFFSPQKMFK